MARAGLQHESLTTMSYQSGCICFTCPDDRVMNPPDWLLAKCPAVNKKIQFNMKFCREPEAPQSCLKLLDGPRPPPREAW